MGKKDIKSVYINDPDVRKTKKVMLQRQKFIHAKINSSPLVFPSTSTLSININFIISTSVKSKLKELRDVIVVIRT